MPTKSNQPDLLKCSTCQEFKQADAFWKDSSRPNGKDQACKECRKAASREARYRNKRINIVNRSILKYPEKQAARKRIRTLIISGELVSQPCFLCDRKDTQGHHLSYDYPEKVVWLCSAHHSEVHHV